MTTPSASTARFVWHDLMTPDPVAARSFYTDLFGWTTQAMDMGELGDYTMFATDGEPHSGVVHLDRDAGHPPHWMAYLGLEDVDAAAAYAVENEGRVLVEAFDIPTVGRTAVLADPTGAVFSPFRGVDSGEMPSDAPDAGRFVWHELMTGDVEAALAFYTGLTRWTTSQVDMGEAGTYHLFHPGAQTPPVVGMMELQGVPSHWLPYVGVSDLDAAIGRSESLGATLRVPATRLDEHANVHFAIAVDPQGAAFGLLEV